MHKNSRAAIYISKNFQGEDPSPRFKRRGKEEEMGQDGKRGRVRGATGRGGGAGGKVRTDGGGTERGRLR
jgi:hypothetical protein